MNNKRLEVPKNNAYDYIMLVFKKLIENIPLANLYSDGIAILFDIVSEKIPLSIENRREKWFQEVAKTLDDLTTMDNNIVEQLKNNEEFYSLFIELSTKVQKTHLDEKRKQYANLLKNSIIESSSYSMNVIFAQYIEDLHPIQILLMKNILENRKILLQLDSFDDYYDFLKGTIKINESIDYVWFFLKDLEKRGLVYISNNFTPPDFKVAKTFEHYMTKTDIPILDQPYISISDLGTDFLNMIKG